MSEIKYGLISRTDANVIEKTIDLIASEFYDEVINTTCIGVFDGDTDRGIYKYVTSRVIGSIESFHAIKCNHTAIDNNKDKEVLKPFPECNLIIGNSNEVYNKLEDNSQHLILIDANHSFPYVVSDYFCYRSKVKKGGFLCFHDVAEQAQGQDWQRIGDEKDKDMSISVVKALNEIGLIFPLGKEATAVISGWELVLFDYDKNDRCGGMASFKKLY